MMKTIFAGVALALFASSATALNYKETQEILGCCRVDFKGKPQPVAEAFVTTRDDCYNTTAFLTDQPFAVEVQYKGSKGYKCEYFDDDTVNSGSKASKSCKKATCETFLWSEPSTSTTTTTPEPSTPDPCTAGFCAANTYWDGSSCYDCSYCLEQADDSKCGVGLNCCAACGGSAAGVCVPEPKLFAGCCRVDYKGKPQPVAEALVPTPEDCFNTTAFLTDQPFAVEVQYKGSKGFKCEYFDDVNVNSGSRASKSCKKATCETFLWETAEQSDSGSGSFLSGEDE